jgi:hypothetical protein
MNNDFLDGIDEHFQRLVKLSGSERRNGQSLGGSREDRLVSEIVDHLHNLSVSQREEVLAFIRSLTKKKVG